MTPDQTARPERIVVLLSGGLDSATVLAQAVADGHECHALSVAYGQRHDAELAAASRLARDLGARDHRTVNVDLGQFGGSALTDTNIDVPPGSPSSTGNEPDTIIPVTYVPARNTIMLSVALGYAEVLDADAVHIGVNAVDYSGYPDCRPAFIDAFARLAEVATKRGVEGRSLKIVAPLINLTKEEIIQRGTRLGIDYARTVSCYSADESGQACGRCDACGLRREGFAAAGIDDPTRYKPA